MRRNILVYDVLTLWRVLLTLFVLLSKCHRIHGMRKKSTAVKHLHWPTAWSPKIARRSLVCNAARNQPINPREVFFCWELLYSNWVGMLPQHPRSCWILCPAMKCVELGVFLSCSLLDQDPLKRSWGSSLCDGELLKVYIMKIHENSMGLRCCCSVVLFVTYWYRMKLQIFLRKKTSLSFRSFWLPSNCNAEAVGPGVCPMWGCPWVAYRSAPRWLQNGS